MRVFANVELAVRKAEGIIKLLLNIFKFSGGM